MQQDCSTFKKIHNGFLVDDRMSEGTKIRDFTLFDFSQVVNK